MAAGRSQPGDSRADAAPAPTRPTFARRFYNLGGQVSRAVADVAGHPTAILTTVAISALWLVLRGEEGEAELALALAIITIILTQMVLNQQRRNDRALHLKLDELLIVDREARDEVVAIEQHSEDEIEGVRRRAAEEGDPLA